MAECRCNEIARIDDDIRELNYAKFDIRKTGSEGEGAEVFAGIATASDDCNGGYESLTREQVNDSIRRLVDNYDTYRENIITMIDSAKETLGQRRDSLKTEDDEYHAEENEVNNANSQQEQL